MRSNSPYLSAHALWALLFLAPNAGVGDESELFAKATVWRIRLEVTSEDLKSLRNNPRQYVHATLREGTNVLRDVAVRLKGSSSFQNVDGKPSFTADCDRFRAGQRSQRRGLRAFTFVSFAIRNSHSCATVMQSRGWARCRCTFDSTINFARH